MPNDYTTITADGVTAVVEDAISRGETLVTAVVAISGERTYANTLGLLDEIGVLLGDADGLGPFMARVHPEPEVRAAAVAAEERLQKWSSDLVFRDDLYAAVGEYAATDDAAALTGTDRRSLEFWMRDFRRAGHHLDPEQRNELQVLKDRLIEVQVAFNRTIDEWRDWIDMTRDDLAGLDDAYLERLSPGDAEGTLRVSMDYPEYIPFMEDGSNRALRHALQHKFYNRAAADNTPRLQEAVDLRRRMAEQLGYATWADYAMEVKMADPKAVEDFYGSILPGLTSAGTAERGALQAMLDEDEPGEQLQAWDWAYYDSQQAKRDYGVDQNVVASYFPLQQTVAGMFDITGDVFGLDYRTVADAKAWHPDVTLYEIRDRASDRAIAYFYADLFPREGKYGHAACFSIIRGMRTADGSYRKPVAAIVANFTKPTADSPSLLKHNEALTLFHEFGHVLHYCLTEVDHPRFSGYDTEWDFVEAPSQILENWMWEPEVLQRFARHHQTGEPIPTDLVDKLVAARDQNVALKTLRQAFFGRYDLALHATADPVDVDVAYIDTFPITLLPVHPDTQFGASFGHLMGGYDAGYYGYLWSKVYGDDMFSVFAENGILDPGIGMRYRREVLAKGHSRDAIEHLRAFLGREPNSKAFLKRLGLSEQ